MRARNDANRYSLFHKLAPAVGVIERANQEMAGAANQVHPPIIPSRMILNQGLDVRLPNFALLRGKAGEIHQVGRIHCTRGTILASRIACEPALECAPLPAQEFPALRGAPMAKVIA